jgi:cysteine dioxygenase
MSSQVASVAELLQALDRFDGCAPLGSILELLQHSTICLEDVREYARFGEQRYRRNLLRASDFYHALVICWKSGQRSPIHDHRGSACGVRVLEGTALETVFARAESGLVYASHSRTLRQGQVCGSHDADIHQISNLQPVGQNLVTLHVYSPPLLVMGSYSLTDPFVPDFLDPISEYTLGDGI